MPTKRKAISARIRFEVFKRDKFTCQYCGKEAPEVTLHVDHIDPLSAGGSNEIFNLITSCKDCNLGKGARKINESEEIKKQKSALNELQERQEQLEMLSKWRLSLIKYEDTQLDFFVEFVSRHGIDLHLTKTGRLKVNSCINKYGLNLVLDCVPKSVEAAIYKVKNPKENQLENAFCEILFKKVASKKLEQENPSEFKRRYIKGILSNRFKYLNKEEGLTIDFYVDDAIEHEPNRLDEMIEIAKTATTKLEYLRWLNKYFENESE